MDIDLTSAGLGDKIHKVFTLLTDVENDRKPGKASPGP